MPIHLMQTMQLQNKQYTNPIDKNKFWKIRVRVDDFDIGIHYFTTAKFINQFFNTSIY